MSSRRKLSQISVKTELSGAIHSGETESSAVQLIDSKWDDKTVKEIPSAATSADNFHMKDVSMPTCPPMKTAEIGVLAEDLLLAGNSDMKVSSMPFCLPANTEETGVLAEDLLDDSLAASQSAQHSSVTVAKANRDGNKSKGKGQKTFSQLSTADKIKFIRRRAAAAAIKTSKIDADRQVIQSRSHDRVKFNCDQCGKLAFSQDLSGKYGNQPAHRCYACRTRLQYQPRYSCDQCEMKFRLKQMLMKHKRKKHSQLPLFKGHRCTVCDKSFASNFKLQQHSFTHLNMKFPCERCGKQLGSPDNLQRHFKRNHPIESDLIWKCPGCPAKFVFKVDLRRHSRLCANAIHSCDQSKLKYEEDLSRHQKLDHSAVPSYKQ